MKTTSDSLIQSVIDVGVRTDSMLSLVVATDNDDKPTHFILVIPADQIGKISVPGTAPVNVWHNDLG